MELVKVEQKVQVLVTMVPAEPCSWTKNGVQHEGLSTSLQDRSVYVYTGYWLPLA